MNRVDNAWRLHKVCTVTSTRVTISTTFHKITKIHTTNLSKSINENEI